MRLSRSEVDSVQQGLIDDFGALEGETEGGVLYAQATGTPVPTTPERVPTGKVPKSRSPVGLAGPLLRLACSLYNPNPGGFVDRYLDFSEYTNSRGVADGLLRGLCESPFGGGTGPAPAPPDQAAPPSTPYFGGQCDGTAYAVQATGRTKGNPPECTLTVDRTYGPISWWGPIKGVRIDPIPGSGGGRLQINSRGIASKAISDQRWRDATSWPGDTSCDGGGIVTSVSVSPSNGGPDDCGDPGPEVPTDPDQPTEGPLPPSTYDPGDGGAPITINPDISIEVGEGGPQLVITIEGDQNGDTNIEYNYDVGGVNINFPTVPAECCPPTATDPKPPDVSPEPDAEVPPSPPEVPPEEEAGDEPDTVFRAVIVTASNISTPSTPIFAVGGGPTVYAPRLGTLQFKIATADGAVGWTQDIDIKNARQYIEVPAVQGAINVATFPYGTTDFSVLRLYQTIDAPIGVNS